MSARNFVFEIVYRAQRNTDTKGYHRGTEEHGEASRAQRNTDRPLVHKGTRRGTQRIMERNTERPPMHRGTRRYLSFKERNTERPLRKVGKGLCVCLQACGVLSALVFGTPAR